MRSKTVNGVSDADKEVWVIDEDAVVMCRMSATRPARQLLPDQARKARSLEEERALGRERKRKWRERQREVRNQDAAENLDPDAWRGECERILGKLMRNQEHAWPFCEPVDPVALSLPDYFDVVQTPMDLGEVQQRLSAKTYTCSKEFVRDVALTFDNALRYNPESNFVYKHALAMKAIFERLQGNSPILSGAPSTRTKNRSAISGNNDAQSATSRSRDRGNRLRDGKGAGAAGLPSRGKDSMPARSLLDRWKSSRPVSGKHAGAAHGRSASLRKSERQVVQSGPSRSCGFKPPSLKGKHEPVRAPKRRLETDDRGRSLMPSLKRPLLRREASHLAPGDASPAGSQAGPSLRQRAVVGSSFLASFKDAKEILR